MKSSNASHGILIGHNFLFLVGFLYYFIVPYFIGTTYFLKGYPGYGGWYIDFHSIRSFEVYWFFCFFMFFSFYLGSFVAYPLRYLRKLETRHRLISPSSFASFFLVSILIFVFLSIVVRNGISFSGYRDGYNHYTLGAYATLVIAFSFLFLYFFNVGYKYFSLFCLSMVMLISVILMLHGSRMYVLIPFLSIIFFLINFKYSGYGVAYFVGGAMFFILVIFLGMWRIGLDYNWNNAAYILFSEPSFTAWSTLTYIDQKNEMAFQPYDFISSFYNIIPRPLFPAKGDLILSLSDYVHFESPLGAQSLFVSLVGNFGFYMSFIFIFLFSIFLAFIKNLSYRFFFFKWYYVFLLSVLPFSFFRDPFLVVNKLIVLNGFLLPIFMLFFLSLSVIRKRAY